MGLTVASSPLTGSLPGLTFTSPALFADGTAAAPSITFNSDTDSGGYRIGADNIGWSVAGAKVLDISASGLGVTGYVDVGGSADVLLRRDAADVLALQHGTTAQAVTVYNTWSSAGANYERTLIGYVGNAFYIAGQSAGTGVARAMNFQIGSSTAWQMSATGHLLAGTDNTYDIGASGATRPRNLYVAGTATIGGNLAVSAATASATNSPAVNLNVATSGTSGNRIGSATTFTLNSAVDTASYGWFSHLVLATGVAGPTDFLHYYANPPTFTGTSIRGVIGFYASVQGNAKVTGYGVGFWSEAQANAATSNIGYLYGASAPAGTHAFYNNTSSPITSVGGVTLLTTAALTLGAGGNIVLDTGTGTKVGTATSQLLGFYNATPIAQRAGAAQAAVVTTASTQTTPFGYATQAQADALVTLVNELRAWAVAQGFIKGAA
jgi:hypothetical protein